GRTTRRSGRHGRRLPRRRARTADAGCPPRPASRPPTALSREKDEQGAGAEKDEKIGAGAIPRGGCRRGKGRGAKRGPATNAAADREGSPRRAGRGATGRGAWPISPCNGPPPSPRALVGLVSLHKPRGAAHRKNTPAEKDNHLGSRV